MTYIFKYTYFASVSQMYQTPEITIFMKPEYLNYNIRTTIHFFSIPKNGMID